MAASYYGRIGPFGDSAPHHRRMRSCSCVARLGRLSLTRGDGLTAATSLQCTGRGGGTAFHARHDAGGSPRAFAERKVVKIETINDSIASKYCMRTDPRNLGQEGGTWST